MLKPNDTKQGWIITDQGDSLIFYRLFCFVLAVLYGTVLSDIPNDQFKDYGNYLTYGEFSWVILQKHSYEGVLTLIFNEPVWLLLNSLLSNYMYPETVIKTIIFLSASSVAWLVLTRYPKYFIWLILFLLFPLVVKNYLIHLRQGAAIALFLWGWSSSNRYMRWLFMGLAPFVHASFFYILFFMWLAKWMVSLRLGQYIRLLVFLSMGVLFSLSSMWLTSFVGARQAEHYDFSMTEVSGIGFAFWLAIFVLMVMEGKTYLREHVVETGILVFYLSSYWLIEVTGRVFESGIILLLLAGLSLTGYRQAGFFVAIFLMSSLIWAQRFSRPLLGYGVFG